MKTVMKKIFSLLLVAVLLVSAVPFQASADEVTPVTAVLKLGEAETPMTENRGADWSASVEAIMLQWFDVDTSKYAFSNAYIYRADGSKGEAGLSDKVYAGDEVHIRIKEIAPAPAPQPCPTCGNAAHEGDCCATCKQLGHVASAHCASCGSLDHAASAHCANCGSLDHAASAHCPDCNAVGSHDCPNQQPEEEFVSFVFTVDGSTQKVLIENGKVITPAGKTFNGWRFDGWQYQGSLKGAGATLDVAGPTTIYSSYTDTNPTATYELNVYVRRYVGKVLKETSYLIGWDSMQKNDNVLDWLDAHETDIVNKVNSKYPGYTWNHKYYNFYHEQAATSNVTTTNGQKNIYINIKDEQETVLVYVHLDGKKDHAALIQLDGYSAGETVTSSAAASAVKKSYSYSKLFMYSETGWEDHLAGRAYVTTKGVLVEPGTTKIHVNLHDPNGANTSSSSSSSSSKADSTNPKTGDTIFMPAMVLGVSASALAVLFYLNKKRAY